MGLEESPQKEDSIRMKNDVKEKEGKQGKVLRKNSKSSETLNRENRNESLLSTDKKSIQTNNIPPVRDSKVKLKVEKIQENPDGSSKLVNSGRNQQRKDLKILGVGVEAVPGPKLATTMMNKQQNHAIPPNKVNGLQSFKDSEKKQNLKEKEGKIIESGIKVPVLNTEQQKAENSRTLKAEEKKHNRIEYKVNSHSTEKRNADNGLLRSQQKPQDQHLLLQQRLIRRTEHSEDKRQANQKDQQSQKQNMVAKNHEGQQVESGVASKSKKSTAINLQKRLSREKSAPGNGRSAKSIEKVPMKDPPNGRHPDVASMIDISIKTVSDQEIFKKEDQSRYSSPREPQPDIEKESSNPVLTEEKQIEVSATQKKAIPREVQRNEIPRKIDVLMTRRNATVNHLTRPIKQQANMLKDLKQQMHIKNRSSKRMEEESDSQVKEGKTGIRIYNASEVTTEPVRQEDKLRNEADQMINSVADECHIQNIQITSTMNDNETTKKAQNHTIFPNDYKQFPASAILEQLTEPEKDLKEILIKSQLFLSTAEALFKLNIPVSFLHVGDHDYEVAETKLILDTAYEVMKRKARRYEVTYHPYTKTNISCTKLRSLDNLVKQLCKDLEILKFYGGHENDVAVGLYEMLNKDIYNKGPDVNSMWDFEWSNMMSMFPEKEEVIKEVERHMINGLLDEITNDLVLITVSV
ncbi:UNVERIFIED_CONTAM: hypothetical protein Slati_2576600 [Sesamum latifolium]|uniref:DUF4378 domain-containing protein n=1 Tax=Sesamum latifolium TaxID=2727402 RepID=A0AAW2VT90_9LAMI